MNRTCRPTTILGFLMVLLVRWLAFGGESATNNGSIEISKSAEQGRYTSTYIFRKTVENNSYQVTARKSLFDIINELRPESETLLFDDEALADDLYDLKIVGPEGADERGTRWKAFEKVLREKLKLGLAMRTRKVETIELRLAPGGPKGFTTARAGEARKSMTLPGGCYGFTNYSMGEFVDWLEKNLPQSVSDKTNLKGDYSFALPCWPASPEDILAALPKLGLVPKTVTNELQVFMIERVKQ